MTSEMGPPSLAGATFGATDTVPRKQRKRLLHRFFASSSTSSSSIIDEEKLYKRNSSASQHTLRTASMNSVDIDSSIHDDDIIGSRNQRRRHGNMSKTNKSRTTTTPMPTTTTTSCLIERFPVEVQILEDVEELCLEDDHHDDSYAPVIASTKSTSSTKKGKKAAAKKKAHNKVAPYDNEPHPPPPQTHSREAMLATVHYERAVTLAAAGDLPASLDSLERCSACLETATTSSSVESSSSHHDLRWTVSQLEAQVRGQMGEFAASLAIYQRLLAQHQRSQNNKVDAERANLCYACGRLCAHLGQTEQALDYYAQELLVTRAVLGPHNNAVSRILHAMATLHLHEQQKSRALYYYQQALRLEQALLRDQEAVVHKCKACRKARKQNISACQLHLAHYQEAKAQVQETQRCCGRIHFEQGNLERAFELSIPRF